MKCGEKNICDLIFSFFFFLLFFIYNISMLDKKMLLFGDRYFDKISWSTSNFLNCFLPQNNIMICKKFTHFSSTNFRKYHENSLWMNVFINQSIFWIYEKYKHLATISCSYTFCFGIFDCEILYSWFFFFHFHFHFGSLIQFVEKKNAALFIDSRILGCDELDVYSSIFSV